MSLFFDRRASTPTSRAVGFPDSLVPPRGGFRRSSAPVSRDEALGIPAVWACVGLRADIVSSLPLQVFRSGPDGIRVPRPTPTVLDQPSASFDIVEWLYASQVSLDLRGNAYGIIATRDGLGRPTQIELQDPDTVVVMKRRVDDPKALTDGPYYYRINGKPFDAYEIWHERANTVAGSPVGLSPIAYFARTLGINIASEAFGADWFADGAHPSALLRHTGKQELTDGQARTAKARFAAALTGREPLVLSGAWDYKALSISPNESQFIETMKYGGQQVCRIFRTPPEMVGYDSGSSMTYGNVEQRGIQYRTFNIGPTLRRRERRLSTLIVRPDYCVFDADELSRTDLRTRWLVHQIAVKSKIRPQDEIRREEHLPPLSAADIAQLKDLAVMETESESTSESVSNVVDPADAEKEN